MTYQEALHRFFRKELTKVYSLDSIREACSYFWNPEKSYKSIHITGTNGKWSTSKMIFSILKEAGYTVWVYTSPHLTDIRERWETIDGLMSEEQFIHYVSLILSCPVELSYFEKCTLLGFLYFRDVHCEYAVIEVGMWGRLDATNVLNPEISIITSIWWDHMDYLGDTLEKIAFEKWWIIKPGKPVVLYAENETLIHIAEKRWSPIFFPYEWDIRTNLLGDHQERNASIAYKAWEILGIWDDIIRAWLMKVSHRGRLQYVYPNLLLDGAHNDESISSLLQYIDTTQKKWDTILFFYTQKYGKDGSYAFSHFFPGTHSLHALDLPNALDMTCPGPHIQNTLELYGWRWVEIFTPERVKVSAKKNPTILHVVCGSLYALGYFL